MELHQLSILQAKDGLKKGKFSAKELVKSLLQRIRNIDKKTRAFVTLNEKEALNQAEKIDKEKDFEKKPLLGIPIAVKDNFCTKGLRTTASSNILKKFFPVYEATVVKKLKDAGAILIGKTNLDAWAHGSSTETSDFFTSRNPWDIDRLPGGSSGGSAAAVAADMCLGAIGSETSGSIRQPAAWCGVVGLKPTYGRVSRYGLIAMGSSLDCPGPMTKTVEDAALLLEVLAGKDEKDATTLPKPTEKYLKKISFSIKGLKIGVPKEYFIPEIQKEVLDNVWQAVKLLEKMGGKILEISLLDPKYSVAVYTIIQRSEVSSNLARYDGIRYGEKREMFGEEAKRRIMLGTYALSAGYYDQYYVKAQKVRTLICQDFEKAFQKVDIIVGPTSPSVALPVGATKDSFMFGELQDILVEASSLAGLPGINVCCGFSKENLPVGLQIIGPQLSEQLILDVAYAYQQQTDWHKLKPNL